MSDRFPEVNCLNLLRVEQKFKCPRGNNLANTYSHILRARWLHWLKTKDTYRSIEEKDNSHMPTYPRSDTHAHHPFESPLEWIISVWWANQCFHLCSESAPNATWVFIGWQGALSWVMTKFIPMIFIQLLSCLHALSERTHIFVDLHTNHCERKR